MTRPSLRLSLLVALLVGLAAKPAHAQFGVSAGLNYNRLNDITLNDRESAFDNRSGWHIEAWAGFGAGPLALRPGIRYVQAGTLFEGLSDVGTDRADEVDVSLVEIPIHLRFRFPNPAVTPYVLAGPVVRFPFSDDDDLDEDLQTSVAGEVGAGLELNLGAVRLYPELAFAFGLSRFVADEFTIAGRTFVADDEPRLNSVMLRLGIGL